MPTLPTWADRSSFEYIGSVAKGTRITYGRGFTVTVTPSQYRDLLDHFGGSVVKIGTSRTDPPPGSVGEWLQANVTRAAIASYVGAILVHEGYAEKAGGPLIRFVLADASRILRQLLQMIEDNGGPEGLDLSGRDLSGIDLGRAVIVAQLEKRQQEEPGAMPPWVWELAGRVLGINLQGADFSDTNLRGARLTRARLEGAVLDNADLQEARLHRANLRDAHVSNANLQDAELHGAELQRATLIETRLQGAFLNEANLRESKLQDTDLQEARLSGANLEEARLNRADLRGAHLIGANLRGATLMETDLRGAQLMGATLCGAGLYGANLKDVNLLHIDSAAGAYWYGAQLERTQMTWRSLAPPIGEEGLKRYSEAQEAYLALKNNFRQLGRYEDAVRAYQKERQMEKHTHWPLAATRYYALSELAALPDRGWRRRCSVLLFWVTHLARYCLDWFEELLCGYGENPRRILGWGVVALVVFPLLYWLCAGVGENGVASTRVQDYVIFSLGAFTTMDLAGLEPVGTVGRLLAALEALTGILIAGLTLFTLGNRIRRS